MHAILTVRVFVCRIQNSQDKKRKTAQAILPGSSGRNRLNGWRNVCRGLYSRVLDFKLSRA